MTSVEEIDKKVKKVYHALLSISDPNIQEQLAAYFQLLVNRKPEPSLTSNPPPKHEAPKHEVPKKDTE
jgi:hypothetical protein